MFYLQLYELPANYPISTLMVDFLQYSAKEVKQEESTEPTVSTHQSAPICQITADLRHEFVAGLQHYFNLIVGSQLLYKFERLQYAELLKQHADKRMSDVYGPMHVLRLFGQFYPAVLALSRCPLIVFAERMLYLFCELLNGLLRTSKTDISSQLYGHIRCLTRLGTSLGASFMIPTTRVLII